MPEYYCDDDKIKAALPDLKTVSEVLEKLRYWYNWGDYDKTGAAILDKLGEVGFGDPDAVKALERSSTGQILLTRSAALRALKKLAEQGDSSAAEALKRSEAYWREVELREQEQKRQRAALALQREAEQLGITVEELIQQQP